MRKEQISRSVTKGHTLSPGGLLHARSVRSANWSPFSLAVQAGGCDAWLLRAELLECTRHTASFPFAGYLRRGPDYGAGRWEGREGGREREGRDKALSGNSRMTLEGWGRENTGGTQRRSRRRSTSVRKIDGMAAGIGNRCTRPAMREWKEESDGEPGSTGAGSGPRLLRNNSGSSESTLEG